MTVPSSIAIIYLNADSGITINADGSVNPQDAPILRSGDYYTLQSDISESISIYRKNATIDGANKRISLVRANSTSGPAAVSVKADGVTVKNFIITNCTYGIRQQQSSGSTIENNNIYNTDFPIKLENSSSSTVLNNIVELASHGILLDYSTNNTITLNNCSNCVAAGIILQNSDGNIINHNKLRDNDILITFSNGNQLTGNEVTNTEKGYDCISLTNSASNTVSGNLLVNNGNGPGIELNSENYDTIQSNIISNCSKGIWLQGKNNYNKIFSNALTNNSPYGINLDESDSNQVFGNSIKLSQQGSDTEIAIELSNSSSNAFYSNTVSEYPVVVRLAGGASNRIYGNKMLSPQPIVILSNAINTKWDNGYPAGGNFWSNYAGSDAHSGSNQQEAGNDGIGDTACQLRAYNDKYFDSAHAVVAFDNYPLMMEWTNPTITKVSVDGKEDVVTIITKTSILQIASASNMLNFTVSGPDGEHGFAHITCPKMNTTALRVYIDGSEHESTITSDESNYYIYFKFSLSTHQITIPFTPSPLYGEVPIKFTFAKVARPSDSNPNITDTRYLSVAFDYVAILDTNKNVLAKIDIGTEEARSLMGKGWSRNQQNWGDAANFAWTEGTDKTAFLNAKWFPEAQYLSVKTRPLMQNNTVQVYYNDQLVATFDPDIGWNEYTLELPQTPPIPENYPLLAIVAATILSSAAALLLRKNTGKTRTDQRASIIEVKDPFN